MLSRRLPTNHAISVPALSREHHTTILGDYIVNVRVSRTVANQIDALYKTNKPIPTAYRIFLFGSRASSKARPNSDIDIGIEGPDSISTKVLSSINEELEEADTLYSIDVIDFSRVSEKFRSVAHERTYLPL